jgi:hypothetical protein
MDQRTVQIAPSSLNSPRIMPVTSPRRQPVSVSSFRSATRRRYRNAAFDPGGDCGADVSRGPFNFWKTTPHKVVFGCDSFAPRQGEIGFAFSPRFGAEVAVTYLNDKATKFVEPLANLQFPR